jgi:hypothetical protein
MSPRPIPDELAGWIEKWVPRERRLKGDLLFTNPHTGGPWSETSLKLRVDVPPVFLQEEIGLATS